MAKFRVVMICREISRAETIIEAPESDDYEKIKDEAWSCFDAIADKSLEQENYTKVESIKEDSS